MKPTLLPRDTAISVKTRSPLGLLLRLLRHPHPGDIAIIELPWEHDLIGIKRLVAGPGTEWVEGDDPGRRRSGLGGGRRRAHAVHRQPPPRPGARPDAIRGLMVTKVKPGH